VLERLQRSLDASVELVSAGLREGADG
jgi:hypothetical protein